MNVLKVQTHSHYFLSMEIACLYCPGDYTSWIFLFISQYFNHNSIFLLSTKMQLKHDHLLNANSELVNHSLFRNTLTKLLALDTPSNRKHTNHSVQNESNSNSTHQPSIAEMDYTDFFSNYYENQDFVKDSDSRQFSPAKRARSEPTNDATTTSDESTSMVGGGSQRRVWVKNRSNAWWEQVNSPDFPEEEFKKAFRMSKATFDMICDELEPVVTRKDTMLRRAIPVRQRVAVCVWRLATGEALREVSRRFGLGISTCHKLGLEVCSAISNILMPKFLQWPDENRKKDTQSAFELMSGISNIGGSIYTSHVPIIAPKENAAAYFNKLHSERNQKTSYSVTVQGVVDHTGVFTDICIGWPGSMTDDQVLEKSVLFQRASRGLFSDIQIVGNSNYPLMDWVLVPYTNQNLTWTQHMFNKKISKVQGVAVEAFMRMKARWSCLQKRTEMKLQDLPVVLGACCVLHNICEMRNEGLNAELRFELFDDEVIPENTVRSVSASLARDKIAHKLLHHNLGGTNFQ